jgi:rRNA maturation endonuclease Nob1
MKKVCRNCNYRFETERETECPYCGKETLEKEKSAEELLIEIGNY